MGLSEASVIRLVALALTMVTTGALTAFTVAEWDHLSPRVMRPVMVCVITLLLGIVYGLGEAAHQHAPLGLRIVLTMLPIAALLVVLVRWRIRHGRRR